ncbi:MAG: phosphoribosyl-ATP diphosphatase [Pseudomonadota bacterium]
MSDPATLSAPSPEPRLAPFGAALDRLAQTVAARAGEGAETSYTARLLSAGVPKCAQKLGEEAVELAIAAVSEDRDEVRKEASDLLYHLVVLLRAAGVDPSEVAAELSRREGVSGLAEKAARAGPVPSKAEPR